MRLDRDGIDRSPLDRSGEVTVFAVYLAGAGDAQADGTGDLYVVTGIIRYRESVFATFDDFKTYVETIPTTTTVIPFFNKRRGYVVVEAYT